MRTLTLAIALTLTTPAAAQTGIEASLPEIRKGMET
jgi:hypothetical protein